MLKFVKSHPHVAALGGVLGLIGALSAFLDLTEKFRDLLPTLALRPAALTALAKTAAPFTDLFATVVLASLVVAAVFVVFLPADLILNIGNRRERQRLADELKDARQALGNASNRLAVAESQTSEAHRRVARHERQNSRLSATVNAATAAHHAIINRLYSADQAPKFDFHKAHESYVFSGRGDAHYVNDVVLKGGPSPAHFWVVWREADAAAPGVDLLEDVKLRVESLDPGTDVAILPTESKPHRQEFAIFFLPEIEPGELRRLKISFTWPGYAADLAEKGETRLFWSFRTRLTDATTDFSLRLRFEPPFTRVVCRSSGAWNKASSTLNSEARDGSVDTWTFTDPKLRLHANEYALEIKWLDWPGADQPPPPPPPPGSV